MILEGSLTLYNGKYAESGKHVRTMGPGDGLGELGIIKNEPRSLTAISLGCSIITIDAFTFRKTMKMIFKAQLNAKIEFI